MIGATVSGFIAATIPLFFSSSVYTDYIQLNRTAKLPTYDWQTPTIGRAAGCFLEGEIYGFNLFLASSGFFGCYAIGINPKISGSGLSNCLS
jgi:hypothetical protein